MTDERLASLTLERFLEVLGSDAPTPGGGAAGAISGGVGASLIAMVGRLTVGKPGFEDVEDRMHMLIEQADAALLAFLDLADRDAHAFDEVMVAFKMPKETDEDKAARSAAIQAGYEHAASVPLEIAHASVNLMKLAEDATSSGNPQAASDGVSGAAHLYCATICAIANVEINAASLKDESRRTTLLDEVAALRGRADRSMRESQTAFQLRLSS
ncbi:MAG: cyclodeaminase/cyclohydrolase family protein [Actinomycetota bacterium]